jgi:hypothetical protein
MVSHLHEAGHAYRLYGATAYYMAMFTKKQAIDSFCIRIERKAIYSFTREAAVPSSSDQRSYPFSIPILQASSCGQTEHLGSADRDLGHAKHVWMSSPRGTAGAGPTLNRFAAKMSRRASLSSAKLSPASNSEGESTGFSKQYLSAALRQPIFLPTDRAFFLSATCGGSPQ